MEIDVSKIIPIPSDTEIPVHDNPIHTKRPLCANFPENSIILDKTEAIKVITDISEDLERKEEKECIKEIPTYIDKLQAVFDPLNVEECKSDLFESREIKPIETIEDLKKFLSELLIRFDTSPSNYQKSDYMFLITLLYKSLIHLYEHVVENLAPVAYSGDIADLTQQEYFILDCGSSTKNV